MISKQTITSLLLGSSLIMGSLMPSGCMPVAVVGGAGAVATSAAEERGVGGVLSDSSIKTRVQLKIAGHSSQLLNRVTVSVHQGRVLLTGLVDKAQMQIDAVRLAWQADGVQEVIDELRVGKPESFGSYTKDSWISTQLKSSLLFDEKVQSINYNIHTIAGVVYLLGVAQNQQELNHVIQKARNIEGVKQVVSHVRLKYSGTEKEEISSTPSRKSAGEKPERLSAHQKSSAEPKKPIQVQELEPESNFDDLDEEETLEEESLNKPNRGSSFD